MDTPTAQLRYATLIRMANGIRKPVQSILPGDFVLGIHQDGQLGPSEVLAAVRHSNPNIWIATEITRRNRRGKANPTIGLTSGPNHPVWNPQLETYRPLFSLSADSPVLTLRIKERIPFAVRQVMIGKLLGDGYLHVNGNVAAVTFSHRIQDQDYVEWTSAALGDWGHPYRQSRVSGYGSQMIGAHSRYSRSIKEEFSSLYSTGPKSIPDWLADELDPISLAFWYMDDGSRATSKFQKDRAMLATDCFSNRDLDVLQQGLRRLGLETVRQATKSRFALRFNTEAAMRMFSLVSPYIPRSMDRKIPEEFRLETRSIPIIDPIDLYLSLNYDAIKSTRSTRSGSAAFGLVTRTGNYFASDVLSGCSVTRTGGIG